MGVESMVSLDSSCKGSGIGGKETFKRIQLEQIAIP